MLFARKREPRFFIQFTHSGTAAAVAAAHRRSYTHTNTRGLYL